LIKLAQDLVEVIRIMWKRFELSRLHVHYKKVAACRDMPQIDAACRRMLQTVACGTLRHASANPGMSQQSVACRCMPHRSLRHVATSCGSFRHVAACRGMPQHSAAFHGILPHAASADDARRDMRHTAAAFHGRLWIAQLWIR
jgi:hypothetical protein